MPPTGQVGRGRGPFRPGSHGQPGQRVVAVQAATGDRPQPVRRVDERLLGAHDGSADDQPFQGGREQDVDQRLALGRHSGLVQQVPSLPARPSLPPDTASRTTSMPRAAWAALTLLPKTSAVTRGQLWRGERVQPPVSPTPSPSCSVPRLSRVTTRDRRCGERGVDVRRAQTRRAGPDREPEAACVLGLHCQQVPVTSSGPALAGSAQPLRTQAGRHSRTSRPAHASSPRP